MIVGEHLEHLTGQREGRGGKHLHTNRSNSAVFPCIVPNVKYVCVCDNVCLLMFIIVLAYCEGGPL